MGWGGPGHALCNLANSPVALTLSFLLAEVLNCFNMSSSWSTVMLPWYTAWKKALACSSASLEMGSVQASLGPAAPPHHSHSSHHLQSYVPHTHPSHPSLTLTPHTHPSHSPLTHTPHTHPSHSPLTPTPHTLPVYSVTLGLKEDLLLGATTREGTPLVASGGVRAPQTLQLHKTDQQISCTPPLTPPHPTPTPPCPTPTPPHPSPHHPSPHLTSPYPTPHPTPHPTIPHTQHIVH